jgi:intracellular septation protein A
MADGTTLWRYRRRFKVAGKTAVVTLSSRTSGLTSELSLDGAVVARDQTPLMGAESVRNHRLVTTLPDGSALEIEAGWISALNTGIAVRHDGTVIHESHPGRTIAYPEKYREMAVQSEAKTFGEGLKEGWKEGLGEAGNHDAGYDFGALKRNRIPLAVDISLGLLFFAIAKLTDLTTAAIAGAIIGLILLAVQRATRIDLLGGLALFGIAMMLVSAGLAIAFQSDDAVKYRTTFMGLLSATLFFVDGVFGGKRLASRLERYLPYNDIDVRRLGIGMGLMGVVMAGMNQAVAMLASTDVWLFYTTFLDFILAMGVILFVFRWARGQMLRNTAPVYRVEAGS